MWSGTFSFIFIAIISICAAQNEIAKTVTIPQGSVRGYKTSDSEVFQFFGIPYATIPKGVDKFKAPLAAPTWTNTLDAVDATIACPQHPSTAFGVTMQEECLVANVFTPDTDETNLPVLVIIHGGGFILGFGQLYSPKPLVESKKIVAVTFNYRLGSHGFLCLGTEQAPGNAALKDMLAALRWVKNNIAHFGGNPDDITLLGYSAGSAAADLLLLSKPAQGLFNKIIPESGANVGVWSVQKDPIKNAQDYALRQNYTNVGTIEGLEEFYTTAPYELLSYDMTTWPNYESDSLFAPCLEKDLGQEIVLDEPPVNIIKRGDYNKIPVLYGFANMEGRLRLPDFDSWVILMNENFSNFLPADLQFESDNQKAEVAQTVKEFYFGDQRIGLYTLFEYINYFSDITFAYPTLRSAQLQVEAGSNYIYLYEYTFYRKFPSFSQIPDVLINFPGAEHCAQTEAVLEFSLLPIPDAFYTAEYRLMRTQIRELWLNFITTGTPVPEGSTFPEWPPTNASRTPYMIIGQPIELGGSFLEQRALFWDGIYEQYYRYPEPPGEIEDAPGSASKVSGGLLGLVLIFCNLFLF